MPRYNDILAKKFLKQNNEIIKRRNQYLTVNYLGFWGQYFLF